MQATKRMISVEDSEIMYTTKVFLMIMVLFIHINSYFAKGSMQVGDTIYDMHISDWLHNMTNIISYVISGCAVPGFFFFAGYLLYLKDFKWADNMKKRIRKLLIPYVLVNSFWILFYVVVQKVPVLAQYFTNSDTHVAKWNWLDWVDAYTGIIHGSPTVYPLWFVRDLFIINIFAVLLKKLVDKAPRLMLVVMLLLCIFDIKIGGVTGSGIGFFLTGYYFVKYDISLSCVTRVKLIPLTVVYIVLVILTNIFSGIQFVTTVAGLLFFMKCAYIINQRNKNNFLRRIAPYTYCIFLFHEMNMRIVQKIVFKLLPQSKVIVVLEYFLIPFCIMGGCIILAILLKQCVPVVYSLISGEKYVMRKGCVK